MTSAIMHLLPLFQQGCWTTAVGLLIYALARFIYNVFFHPLSRFPGPRGAACTKWWLAYMMFVKGVSLSTLREQLHQKYGIGALSVAVHRELTVGQVTLYGSPRMR
jgi:hypothetical protein